MPDSRILAQLQHAMQYPSGHLDRFASFGPAFEMSDASPRLDTPAAVLQANQDTITYQLAHEPRPEPIASPAVTEPATEVSDIASIRRFITGGRAIFTLQGASSRYTYRVNLREASDQYPRDAWFVQLLTGPDNTADYTYMGMLDVDAGKVYTTRASKYQPDSAPIKAINWALARIWRGQEIAPAIFYHVGRCGRCGRALTVPSSIESGFGPECLGKL